MSNIATPLVTYPYSKPHHQFEAESFELMAFVNAFKAVESKVPYFLEHNSKDWWTVVALIERYQGTLKRLGWLDSIIAEFGRRTIQPIMPNQHGDYVTAMVTASDGSRVPFRDIELHTSEVAKGQQ